MIVEYTLGDRDVDINDLARLITQAITGKDNDRDTQKRIRQNIAMEKTAAQTR